MTTPRRRLIRPHPVPGRTSSQLPRARARLDKDRVALARWMARLKRAFNAVDKQQHRISRLERRIRLLEQTHATSD